MVARIPVPGIRRRWPIVVVGAIVLILLLFTAMSGFFVDVLFFRELGFSDVFWGILRTRFLLAFVFGLVFFAALYANLLIVRRFTPRFRPLTLEQEILDRYRMAAEPYLRWLLPAFSLLIAVFVGLGVTSQWQTFLLWRNSSGVTFGVEAPELGRDVAFYVFSLPWLEFVQGWLFSSLVGITVIVTLAHYLWGGIRPQAQGLGEKVTPQVKAHLSVLLGLILLVKAWGYYLGTFDLMLSQRGVVVGASYTDLKAQLPALRILIFIAVACAVLFFVNIRLKGWALPVIAVGLLVLVSIVAGAAYPAFVQRFRVAPQELQKERTYIEHNIEGTRSAFGLDQIDTQQRTVSTSVGADAIQANATTISNIRLWRPEILRENYEGLQRIRQYYAFNDVDVDRYPISGSERVVMISAREVSQDQIPGGGSWQNRHLVYTHGFGSVASAVNTATAEGAPQFTLRDIPPVGEPALEGNGARVYYGERSDVGFVLVNTGADELDYQGTPADDQAQVTFPFYDGEGGIPIGGFLQRALFAWRFRDVNLLISGLIQGDSRIMINRSIYDRVPKVAPFLKYDGDPYAAIVNGRLVWIWDAYTSTAQYPYSQPLRLEDFTSQQPGTPPLVGDVNYIRNSVKVVVDGYNGSVTYYVADPDDPIVRVWRNAFPDLFTALEDAPPELRAHFRYPENLFQVQAAQYGSYHVTDPDVFYGKQDFWQIPEDPTAPAQAAPVGMRPYYMLMRPPGESSDTFVLIQPFTPLQRQNMVAWMAARSDPDSYGQIVAFQFPTGQNIDGPTQVFSRINQDARFSAERTLLSQGGSEVLFGDFLVIPIDTGLLYVQPVYVRSEQANAIPELKRIVVVNGGRVGIGSTLQESLEDSLSGAPVEPPNGGEPPTGTVQQQIQALLAEAARHFEAAQEALTQGDLATYQEEVDAASEAVNRANDLAAQQEGAAPTGTPTPSPSA